MLDIKRHWLPHLETSLPIEAYGYPVSMYSIALEGWRRGLTLKFINNNRGKSVTRYCLSHNGVEHCFVGSGGDKITNEAKKICRNKHLTKQYLTEGGVPVPEGEKFLKEVQNENIIKYANTLGYPLVLKPSDGMGGNGVISNIKNNEELLEALVYVRKELGYKEVIVEQYVHGEDYRLYVVGGNFIGAIRRIPANIIGDGINTVKQLLNLKNQERDLNPALYKRPIKIDKEMKNQLRNYNYTLDSIPEKGERVFLKTKSNISAGGDPIDATDELTDEMKEIAINASEAIPGLEQSGVDLMVNLKSNTAVVLEVNTIPSIRTHLFPMEGRARDIPKAIIDYYFPDTISNHEQPSYYFDIESVFKVFQNGVAQEFTVPSLPKGDLSATRFIVSGSLRGVNYERWVQKQARDLKLHGHIKQIKGGKASIVISGSISSVDKMREIIKAKSSRRAEVDNVVEKARTSPVKVGFSIIETKIGSRSIKNNRKPKITPLKSKVEKTGTFQKERDFYKNEYISMKNSRSWKLTKPVRKMSNLIKRLIST